MVILLTILGGVSMLIGAGFYWLNLNSPVQTCIPVVCLPLGLALLLIALGGLIL